MYDTQNDTPDRIASKLKAAELTGLTPMMDRLNELGLTFVLHELDVYPALLMMKVWRPGSTGPRKYVAIVRLGVVVAKDFYGRILDPERADEGYCVHIYMPGARGPGYGDGDYYNGDLDHAADLVWRAMLTDMHVVYEGALVP